MAVPQRNRLIGAVHAAKKAADLDDDTYRGMLARITGKSSAKDLSDGELRQVLDHMNAGARFQRRYSPPKTGTPIAKKARALWISLHALGAVADPSEQALRAWVKRQHQVDDLAFVRPSQSFAVIEGLKQWCARLGVDWGSHANPRRCVIARQKDILFMKAKGSGDLVARLAMDWLDTSLDSFDDAQLDAVLIELGRMVRGEDV